MKVAICLCGEPRTYRWSANSIRKHYEVPGVDVCYFIFVWDRDLAGYSGAGSFRTHGLEYYTEYDSDLLQRELKNLYPKSKVQVGSAEEGLQEAEQGGYMNLFNAQQKVMQMFVEEIAKTSFDLCILDRIDGFRADRRFIEGCLEVNYIQVCYNRIPENVYAGLSVGSSNFNLEYDLESHNKPFIGDRVLCFSQELAVRYGQDITTYFTNQGLLGNYVGRVAEAGLLEYIRKGMGITVVDCKQAYLETGWLLRKPATVYLEEQLQNIIFKSGLDGVASYIGENLESLRSWNRKKITSDLRKRFEQIREVRTTN